MDAALRPPEHRVERDCDICHQLDDHPRHIVGRADGGTDLRHLDCCRENGCADGSCPQLTAGVEHLRGPELVAHLTGTAPVQTQEG